MGGLFAMTGMTSVIILPALPAMADGLGASIGFAQQAVPVFFAGYALAQLIWGPLSDAYGRRPILLAGGALFVLASVACMLAPSMGVLLVMRLLAGIGAGAGPTVGRAMIRDLYEGPRMARIMSLVQAVFLIGPVIAPIIGAGIVEIGSWRLIFGFLAAYGALMLVVTALLLPESIVARNPGAWRPARLVHAYSAVLSHPVSAKLVLVMVMMFSIHTIFLSTASAILITTKGLSTSAFALAFSATFLFNAVGILLNARLVRRTPLMTLITVGCCGVVLAMVALFGAELAGVATAWRFVLLFGFYYVGMSLMNANVQALMFAPHGNIAGAASSISGVAQVGVPALLAALAGALYDGTAVPVTAMMLACALGAAAALVWVRRAMRRA
jgi:DHA1 family bicyclomycin/chloramphenicol resistance-like MFS transporter